MPILDYEGEVIGVAQIMNKIVEGNPGIFTHQDEQVYSINQSIDRQNLYSAPYQVSFRGETRGGNAVPIVENLTESMGTTLPLLKCLRAHYGRHCEPFLGPKCTRLQDFSYTI